MTASKPLVLIVEDNDIVRMIAIANLKRFADIEIKIACNGHEAIENVKQHNFALILMDIHMPGMDGLQATREIRAAERTHPGRRTPIIAVTASDNRENCLDAGMDDYVTKPADYRRIVDRWLTSHRRYA